MNWQQKITEGIKVKAFPFIDYIRYRMNNQHCVVLFFNKELTDTEKKDVRNAVKARYWIQYRLGSQYVYGNDYEKPTMIFLRG